MKLLVLSDSHSGLSFMRMAVDKLNPDGIIHLGDHYDDGCVLAEENPMLPIYQVPGNCDRYRCPPGTPELLCISIAGVRVMMTHGHKYHVKMGIGGLLAEARRLEAQAVLYGHTHQPDCHREADGLWVLNPGSSGSLGGGVGLLTLEQGSVKTCCILKAQELA